MVLSPGGGKGSVLCSEQSRFNLQGKISKGIKCDQYVVSSSLRLYLQLLEGSDVCGWL